MAPLTPEQTQYLEEAVPRWQAQAEASLTDNGDGGLSRADFEAIVTEVRKKLRVKPAVAEILVRGLEGVEPHLDIGARAAEIIQNAQGRDRHWPSGAEKPPSSPVQLKDPLWDTYAGAQMRVFHN